MTLPTGIDRFLLAQNTQPPLVSGPSYKHALEEVRSGHKRSHWIWYVFPQLKGLGFSWMSDYFGITDFAEAQEYLAHPVLGERLAEISAVLLALDTDDPYTVFYEDDVKVCSCMTLFSQVPGAPPVFREVLEKYYGGEADKETLRRLKAEHD
ncbi:MAG: DUF1810 domain-containing protein [Oscillospiraceae bacterium]|jgi:uncharacterized protein (DUF1810 family)|nr:DUF1810 domain-containing protein [Oscillospiraceae bacterium]